MHPILQKLKTDAGIVLTDMWRACWHLPPRGLNASLVNGNRPVDRQGPFCASAPAQSRNADGLCYFHLN